MLCRAFGVAHTGHDFMEFGAGQADTHHDRRDFSGRIRQRPFSRKQVSMLALQLANELGDAIGMQA
jgi:hypothetical protein